jgi:hypothetical protein
MKFNNHVCPATQPRPSVRRTAKQFINSRTRRRQTLCRRRVGAVSDRRVRWEAIDRQRELDQAWGLRVPDNHRPNWRRDDECAWIAETGGRRDRLRGDMKKVCPTAATSRGMPRRRGLIAMAIGGAAWMSGCAAFLAVGARRRRSAIGPDGLAALVSKLCYSGAIGNACLAALPAAENSRDALTRAIVGDMRVTDRDYASARSLARSIMERSRSDFRDGKVVSVDGWMLSLTETRVYALAALSRRPGWKLEQKYPV